MRSARRSNGLSVSWGFVVKPDDITPEEADAAGRAFFRRYGWLVHGLAAQNALRDQRVAAEAARAERERADRLEAALTLMVRHTRLAPGVGETWSETVRRAENALAFAALREEGDAPDPDNTRAVIEIHTTRRLTEDELAAAHLAAVESLPEGSIAGVSSAHVVAPDPGHTIAVRVAPELLPYIERGDTAERWRFEKQADETYEFVVTARRREPAPDPEPCPKCEGTGVQSVYCGPYGGSVACSSCGGTGHTPTKDGKPA